MAFATLGFADLSALAGFASGDFGVRGAISTFKDGFAFIIRLDRPRQQGHPIPKVRTQCLSHGGPKISLTTSAKRSGPFKREMMRKVLMLSTALTLGTLNPSYAGGPVVIEVDTEVVEAKPASSGGMLIPLLLLAVVLAAAASGGGDDEPVAQPSDIRLKEDVVRVGTNHLGLGVYHYRYKGLEGVFEGVMAHEVEVMHPGAIKQLPFGYKAVNYAKLGLKLRRVH